MRCVSYTRTTSCKSSESIPTDIIQQQNEQIQKYIQSHGWKLVAKYSDRKRDDNENTAFEEMTMDGISRKFDMVVVNSIDRCGKYISCAEDVLAKTFFPAGIHFSVVQDDFCSIEKSREEIDEYFRKEKIAVQIKSMREFAVREQIEGYYNVHDEKYGYILSEDRKELLVEEEAATIVREVFQMLLDGVSVKKIADIMNERGVESPMVHNARVGHKHWPQYENKWSEGSLRRILDCTAYDGYWKKTINGKLCTIPITPILEKGVFDKAKEIVKSRSTTKNRKGGKLGPYVHKIFDEETGKPLYLRNFQSGDSVFVLNSRINELPKSKRIYIEVDVVTRAVKEAIQTEMDMAERMTRYLETEAIQKLLQKEQQQYSEKAWMIFQEMEQVEKDRIPIYEKYQGINLTNVPEEDVEEWIQECYESMSPSNASVWNRTEKIYWEKHQKANKAKPLFDVLNTEDRYHLTQWGCRQCTDTSQVNSQAASRIRALKQSHGYHIATKDVYCPVCKEITPHDILLRIPRKKGESQKRYSISTSLKNRIKEHFSYTDACFGVKLSKGTRELIIDHKFPATRWAAGETKNFTTMTDEQIEVKFQLLTQQTNLQKDRYCFRCFNENIRGDFFGIKWYSKGDEYWQGANKSDENGCVGCPWYDLADWKKKFNEHLSQE